MVRACCIPFSPYHSRSLIWPVPDGKTVSVMVTELGTAWWMRKRIENSTCWVRRPVQSCGDRSIPTLIAKGQAYMDHGTSERHHLLIRVRLHWKVMRRDKVMSCSNTALNAFRTVTYGGLEACERILWEPWWSLSMAAQQQKCAIG